MQRVQASGNTRRTQTATLAGGCFWCLEAVYELVRGVDSVVSGYTGGHVETPTYEQVCTGRTGHAEAVQVTYDPSEVTFGDLLNLFFTMHDPTTLDRQGSDFGPQYRSAVFYHDDDQREAVDQAIGALKEAGTWKDPIVTEVLPAEVFYPAEEHHQHYFERNRGAGYCQVIIEPKVAKLRKEYSQALKA